MKIIFPYRVLQSIELTCATQQVLIVVVVVPLLSHVQLFATPWTVARQASLSFTISWSL